MQGQRGTIGSLPETLDFDLGSSSSNSAMDQPVCWNNIPENRLPECLLSPNDMNIAFVSSMGRERQSLSRWCSNGASSSNAQTETLAREDRNLELNWPPSSTSSVPASNVLPDNSGALMFPQASNSNSIQIQPSLNLGFVGGSEIDQNRPAGSVGFLRGEIDGRHAPIDRRISCKRKSMEGNIGPSSSSGSCSYFDSTARPGIPARNGLSIQGTPRLGLGLPDPNASENPESSSVRNLRMRTASSNYPSFVSPSSVFPPGRAARRSQPPMSLLPVDLRHQSQPPTAEAPPLPPNVQSLRWSGASSSSSSSSSSRNSGLSGSIAFGDRDALREELNSRSTARAIPETPLPPAELRNFVRHHASRSGSANIHGNVANPAPVWPAHLNPPPQYPRRLSEYLQRSLFSSVGAESGGQGGNFMPMRPGHPAVAQEMGAPGHHTPPHLRMAPWLENHTGDGLGIHYSLRSEIRNVIGIIRRGEPLRFEDVMLLDPMVFAGMADLHDRHRDMRLDVDNMSYEELLALEERIGNVSTGLTEEAISKQLKQKKYVVAVKPESEIEPCCVCQEDYVEGDNMGALECGHDFHKDCIKQWLTRKNTCPICKTTALKT